eukprot:615295-Rhodomonas_salina.3
MVSPMVSPMLSLTASFTVPPKVSPMVPPTASPYLFTRLMDPSLLRGEKSGESGCRYRKDIPQSMPITRIPGTNSTAVVV